MKYGVKEVMDVVLLEKVANAWKPVMFFDTLKFSNLETTAESVSARGGQSDPKLLTWDFARDTVLNVQDALASMKTLALLSGNALTTTGGGIPEEALAAREELVADASRVITLSETPIVDTKAFYYKRAANGVETELAGADITSEVGAVVTFAVGSGVVDKDTIIAYYEYASDGAEVVTFTSDDFPGYYRLVGNTVIRNYYTSLDEGFQLIIPRVKLTPGFTMNFQSAGDPSVFDLGFEVFKDPAEIAMLKLVKF